MAVCIAKTTPKRGKAFCQIRNQCSHNTCEEATNQQITILHMFGCAIGCVVDSVCGYHLVCLYVAGWMVSSVACDMCLIVRLIGCALCRLHACMIICV